MRQALAVVALLAACGPPAVTEEIGRTTGGPLTAGDQQVEPTRDELGEVQLLTQPSDSPIITLRVVFDAGSAEDERGREGITNLMTRLMVEGAAGDFSYAERAERLYPMAAELSAYTSRDQTAFVGRVHRDHLDAFYELFLDALARPRFEASDVERVKSQVLSELTLELRGNDDEELGKEVLQAMLYEGHPYGHPVLGTERALRSITRDDVRAHRSRVFCGARALVGVAGEIPDGFSDRLRDDIAALSWPTCVGRRRLPEPDASTSRVRIVHKPEAQAVAISMGVPIDVERGDDDYPALLLAAAYLGQHRQVAGILMQKMRGDRGLNYGDYAYVEDFVQDGWSRFPRPNTARRQQYFSIWIRPVRPEQAHFAARMAVRELRRFVEHGLSAEDFERIRGFATRYFALYLQTESRRLGFAIDDAYYDVDRPFLERLRAAWSSMTVEQVNAAIRAHVDPARLQIGIVAPDAEELAAALSSGAPSPIEYPAEVSDEVLAEDRAIVVYPIGIPRDRIEIVPVERIFR